MFPYQKDMPLSGPTGMPDLPIKPEHIGPPEPPKKKTRRSTPRKKTVRRAASTRSAVVSKTTGRAAPKVSTAARRAAVKDQPRDSDGKFASKVGKFIDRMFEPKIPTKLKKVKRPALEQRSFSENRTLPPRKKVKRKKPPVPQRSFLGRVFSLFNGDYARWSRRNARKQAQIAAQHGYGIPLETKKRRRRRRKSAAPAQQSNYRRGVLRWFLPFL